MQLGRLCRLAFAIVIYSGASRLLAQVVRLPAVVPAQESYPGRLVSHPRPFGGAWGCPTDGRAAQLLQAPGEPALPEHPERPPDARPGMFQKLILDGEWITRSGNDGFGLSSMQLKTVLALPIPSREYPLIVTPGFGVYDLDGPEGHDLPSRVYDAYTQFRWMRRLSPRFGIDLSVTPGVFSDFQQSNDDNFRVTGHGAAAWDWTPATKIVLGAAYINRRTTEMLPICGVIWTPHDDAKFELVFPHPRIARRIYTFGAWTEDVQDWVYVAGELGGGIWAIERATGLGDVIDYTDYRVFLGVERRVIGGLDARLEVGYVFGRELRYDSPTPDLEPDDTIMLRGGLTY